MSDVDTLLAAYVAEHRAGGDADPLAYLQRAGDRDRAELAALIDAYLARAPRRAFDADAYAFTSAELVTDELTRSLDGAGGLWPALLPALRGRAGLRRSELVARLAGALQAGEHLHRVAGYYHLMEQGRLPAAGVSDRVLTALGELLGESARSLREAGAALTPSAHPPAAGPAFARSVRRGEDDADDDAPSPGDVAEAPLELDALDDLFTGGR